MKMRIINVAILLMTIVSILYSVTYHQFRLVGIVGDARSYVAMSHGNYQVKATHRYRFVVPYLASLVRKPIGHFLGETGLKRQMPFSAKKEGYIDQFSFHIVNFVVITIAALLFFFLLLRFGFNWQLSLLGIVMFLTNKTVIDCVTIPLVDSFYLLSIVIIVYLTQSKRALLLALLSPLLILSKETILPIMFLPLFEKRMRNIYIMISLAISVSLWIFVRRYIQGLVGSDVDGSFIDVVMMHVKASGSNLRNMFSLWGLNSLQTGFSFILLFAALGLLINVKQKKYNIPNYLLLLIPVSLAYCLLSGEYGRMFFSSFVVIIPLSLIFIEDCLSRLNRKPYLAVSDGGETGNLKCADKRQERL